MNTGDPKFSCCLSPFVHLVFFACMVAAPCFADSVIIDGVEYADVKVLEGTSMYYFRVKSTGKTLSATKSDVESGAVVIRRDVPMDAAASITPQPTSEAEEVPADLRESPIIQETTSDSTTLNVPDMGHIAIRAMIVSDDLTLIAVPRHELEVIRESESPYQILTATTTFEGEAEFSLSPGQYRLRSIDDIAVGNANYYWDVPFQVRRGDSLTIELSDDNAQIESPEVSNVQPTRAEYTSLRNNTPPAFNDGPTLPDSLTDIEIQQGYVDKSSTRAFTHETRYLNGKAFQVSARGDLQVWIHLAKTKRLEATISLVNGSDRSITFRPGSIHVTAVRTTRNGVDRKTLKTFTPEAYEKKVARRQGWIAALYGASVAIANQPQPQTSQVYGSYSGNRSYGTYYGTITTWPSSADYAAANQRSMAQMESMSAQLKEKQSAISTSLLRTHTLVPGSYAGGVVMIDKKRADTYEIIVPFGDSMFEFSFGNP